MNASSPPRRPDGLDVRRAQRWFWALAVLDVVAMGTLSQGLRSAPGLDTGVLVLVSALVLAAPAVQTARILTVLAGLPRLPRHVRVRPPGRRRDAVHTSEAHAPREQ
ncbi:hypothetical protein ACWCP6_19295 [Streptomyces sp. NPDC002004]